MPWHLSRTWSFTDSIENDFFETLDFEAWLNSGEDWFTYHSGYWCGPASDVPVTVRLFRRYLKGCYSGYRSVRLRLIDDQQPGQPLTHSNGSGVGPNDTITL